jgi:hypothetical protein
VVVNHPRVRHGEDKGPQPADSAGDGPDPGQDCEEDVLHCRLRILDTAGCEVPQHLRRVTPVDLAEQLPVASFELEQ